MYDLLLTNANVATMDGEEPFGLVEDGAIGISGGKIAWIGPSAAAREDQAGEVRDLGGRVVTPGLVDPHTHIVYGEEGLDDFEVLSQGGGRWDLEPAGAGIWAMAKRTRALSEEDLYAASRRRMSRLVANGVTTVESKSGAGLDRDTELRQMRVSRALGEDLPVTVVSTYLGAHGLPPEEFGGRRDDYVTFMCEEVLPEAARPGDRRPRRRLLRRERIQPRADRAPVRPRAVVRTARQAPRRPVHRLRRGRGRREVPRALRRPPGVRLAGDGGGDGRGGHRRDPPARRAPHLSRDPEAPRRPLPRARGADGACDELEPGELAHRLPVVADAPRLLPLPADAGGGAPRIHRERRPRPRSLGAGGADRDGARRRSRGLGHGGPARHRLPDRGLQLHPGRQGRGRRSTRWRSWEREDERRPGAAPRLDRRRARAPGRPAPVPHPDRHVQSTRRHPRRGRPRGRLPRRRGHRLSHRGPAGGDAEPRQHLLRSRRRTAPRAQRAPRRVPGRGPFRVVARPVLG